MLLRIVEGDALLQVGASRDQLAQPEQVPPERKMGFEEECRVVDPLGQAEALFCQFPRRLVLRPHQVKPPQPKQYREELRRLPHLPAQLPGTGVCLPDFRGPLALHRHQCRAQGGLQDQLVLSALSAVRQGREYLDPFGEMAYCFHMRRALDGPLAGTLPVADSQRAETRFRVVMGQQLGLGLSRLREALCQHLRNTLMRLLPGAPEQRLIGCLLNQGVLEKIGCLWHYPALVEQFGGHQLRQGLLQRRFVQRCHRPEQLIGKRLSPAWPPVAPPL